MRVELQTPCQVRYPLTADAIRAEIAVGANIIAVKSGVWRSVFNKNSHR